MIRLPLVSLAITGLTLLTPLLAAEPVATTATSAKAQPQSAHQLNVVYFLGNNREPIAGYEKRLSELLLYTQQFYAREMERNGYGYRSFGLDMKTPERVNIILYRAPKPDTAYPYESGGGWRATVEVNKYLDEQKIRKSAHTLIIFPTWYDEKNTDMTPGGVPFYGLGKVACALDYAHFDIKHLGKNTPKGHLLTKWFGGFAHELGHGLNLPHNMAVGSEKKLGTALMGAGNYTFGMKPTFITEGSCALLERCEVFAKDNKMPYYIGNPQIKLNGVSIKVEKGIIKVKGSATSKLPLSALNVYIEELPLGVNRDYEAHVFTQRLTDKETADKSYTAPFSLSIPVSELVGQSKKERKVRLCFITENGQQQTIIHDLNL